MSKSKSKKSRSTKEIGPQDQQAAAFGSSQSIGDPNAWLIWAVNGGRTHAGTSVSEHNAMKLPVVVANIQMRTLKAEEGKGSM